MKKPTLAPKSYVIEKTNLAHLIPVFGHKLITDIEAKDISQYQTQRQLRKSDGTKGASPKTVNLEIGTLRAILRRYRIWANIQPDVKMLPVRTDIGRAISLDEEQSLLEACRASRSRSLPIAVAIALNTCMRLSEIRLLRWNQLDFVVEAITVGQSKTDAATDPYERNGAHLFAILGREFPETEADRVRISV